jgi:CubicO group peptidase (beta-lactamase class C family)
MLARGFGAVIVALAVTLFASAQASPQAQSGGVDELAGLWKAHRSFGPNARGPLVIRRVGSSYTADMLGRTMTVRLDSGELSFELPDHQGAFRGRVQSGGAISGHWFPPNSPTGFERASPVVLRTDGPGRWSGQVVPAEDTFTFYILAQKRPDGSMGAFLRNPQRDLGAIWGADRLVREGNTIRLMGKRPRQSEEREIAVGTYRSEDSVLTLAFPQRGGSYDFRRESDASDFYPRGRNPTRYSYGGAPLSRDDGWKTGTLEEVDVDRAAIEKLIQSIIDTPMESVHSLQVEGLLIARHGKLVLEEYFHGENRDKLHETRSAAKSMTATIVGAAMYAGAPLKATTPVYQIMNGGAFPPNLDPRKRSMTLENLLTMSSGYFCDDSNADAPGNENTMQDQTAEPDFYRFTLGLPMAFAPGEKAIYCSINPNLALGVVARATGESPLYTFDRLIAGPMKIRHYGWFMDPVGHPYGGGGVHFFPRDFMKIGQLMLDGGTWDGHRILAREFVARASLPLYPLQTMGYGYAWWGIDYPYGNRTVHAFAALGAGGQDVIVVPELDLVVAVYASNYGDRISFAIQREIMPKQIMPAVAEAVHDNTQRR